MEQAIYGYVQNDGQSRSCGDIQGRVASKSLIPETEFGFHTLKKNGS